MTALPRRCFSLRGFPVEKLRVAVLMGGPSSEREVSLRSGQMVLKYLDPTRYESFAVDLNDLLGQPQAIAEMARRTDFVFSALHGRLGEDGTVQGLLESLGLPYQGSDVAASALAMNKVRSKAVYRDMGIPQARALDFRYLGDSQWMRGISPEFAGLPLTPLSEPQVEAIVAKTLGFDLIVKGSTQGSTLGLAVVREAAEFWPAMHATVAFDRELLLEERLPGTEVTAGVIGGSQLQALPLIEIRPKGGDLFDYEAKYTIGASLEICPAPIDQDLAAQIQALALGAHHALGCWGLSRSDFMIKDGKPYILETNTLPGLTENSLIPMAARAAGIMLPELLDRLIGWGLERRARSQPTNGTPAGKQHGH
jgi:D-alanine-D-alanine ligase